jgi:hypothetical protein
MPGIARGDCPAKPTCGTEAEDSTGAFYLAGPKNAVAIYAEAPLATELYRRDRPVAPLNFRSGFRALACRDSRRYRSGASYLSAYGLKPWAILLDHFMVNYRGQGTSAVTGHDPTLNLE